MELETLQELLVDELKDILNAENQLTKALPKMAKKATNEDLRDAFTSHLEETKGQIDRLEKVFGLLGAPARGKKCHAMEGLLEEGKELMEEDMAEDVMDAALIAAAQKVEHYEIASYGTVVAWARLTGNEEVADLLQETLDEEGACDKKLTGLAESVINVEAAS